MHWSPPSGCWAWGLKGADWEMPRQGWSGGASKQESWVDAQLSLCLSCWYLRALAAFAIKFEWSTSNSLSQCCAVTYLLSQHPFGMGRGLGFHCAAWCCGGACSSVWLVILFVIRFSFYFVICTLFSILYNMGHCGKHSKISFPSLKTKKPDKSPGFGGFLTYFWNKQLQQIHRRGINAAALLKASCRSMWLKMCLFNSLERKKTIGGFFFAILSEQMYLLCRTAPLLCCSAGLLKQTDERAWKRSALFALETLNISDRAETPILPWTNSWRCWAYIFSVKINEKCRSLWSRSIKLRATVLDSAGLCLAALPMQPVGSQDGRRWRPTGASRGGCSGLVYAESWSKDYPKQTKFVEEIWLLAKDFLREGSLNMSSSLV